MKNYILVSAFSVLLSLLSGCNKIEQHYAEVEYDKAKKAQEVKPILTALTKLALLNPKVYQSELKAIEAAIMKLEDANTHMAKGDFYQAYLASHDSYRAMPTKQGKVLLLASGEKLHYVMDAQLKIVSSFEYLPSKISIILEKYQQKPILEWDIIEVNAVIGQLGKAARAIRNSLTVIQRTDESLLFTEIESWKVGILAQLAMIEGIQKHLINIALYNSGVILEELNSQLTQESIKLISLVRSELASETMKASFLKARRLYEPYAYLTINLSLASSSVQRNSHAKWYRHWHSIEEGVLEEESVFSNYPILSAQRINKLKEFTKEENLLMPDLNQMDTDLQHFMKKNQAIYSLIERLNRDRMILNYG